MLMWLFIFAGMGLAMLVGVLYIIRKISKTTLVKNIAGENRLLKILLSVAPVAAVIAILYFWIGTINTAIMVVHVLVICILIDLVLWIIRKKSSWVPNHDRVVLATTAFFVIYFIAAWYGAHHIIATRYQVTTDKTTESLRIVQITDSHLGATFDGEGFAKAMEQVQKENPDVVVVTGDFVDDDSSKEDMVRSSKALGDLQTKYGVYFVFGNHDKGYAAGTRGYDANDLIKELESNGVIVLQDENVSLTDSFTLIGRQDRSEETAGGSRASMEELVSQVDQNQYMIVLDHQPNDFANQEKANVDLVLSGHTHGGQFFPINKLGEWFGLNDMTYGIRQQGNTTFEVSSGISDWAIKFKTGCVAEYVVIDVNQ